MGAPTGKSIEQLAYEIVSREGGYVNDPDDRGGATNYGVTIGTMASLGLDLNGDGRVTIEDVKALTPKKAAEIFMDEYFYRPGINKLPKALHDTVFDMQVNAGRNAVKILQRVLNQEIGAQLAVDGSIGPMTIAAAELAASRLPNLRDIYSEARRTYYLNLAERNPSQRKYAKTRAGGKGGWIIRAEEFMEPAYRLTDAEFKQVTEHWA